MITVDIVNLFFFSALSLRQSRSKFNDHFLGLLGMCSTSLMVLSLQIISEFIPVGVYAKLGHDPINELAKYTFLVPIKFSRVCSVETLGGNNSSRVQHRVLVQSHK